MNKLIGLFFSFVCFFTNTTAQTNKTYSNVRFGYQLTYPSTLLKAQPESENKDGRIFHSKAGKERLRCWGRLNQNVDGETMTLKERYEEHLKQYEEDGAVLNYKRYTTTFYVLSGKDKDGINFYIKGIPKKEAEAFAYVLFTYPDAEKNTWEPLIKIIGSSLK
jgi:hypothetical protein